MQYDNWGDACIAKDSCCKVNAAKQILIQLFKDSQKIGRISYHDGVGEWNQLGYE